MVILGALNKTIVPSTFTAADIVSVVGPNGLILIAGNPIAINNTNTSFRIRFVNQLILGQYTIVIGPDIQDVAGNQMDQDQDGRLGEPADDRFIRSFQVVRTPVVVLV